MVPPLAIGKVPVKLILPAADKAILPLAETGMVPLASGNVYVLSAVADPASKVFTNVLAELRQESLLMELLKINVPDAGAEGLEDWAAKLKNPFPPVPVTVEDVEEATPSTGFVSVGDVSVLLVNVCVEVSLTIPASNDQFETPSETSRRHAPAAAITSVPFVVPFSFCPD